MSEIIANNVSNASPSVDNGDPVMSVVPTVAIATNDVSDTSPTLDNGSPIMSITPAIVITVSATDADGVTVTTTASATQSAALGFTATITPVANCAPGSTILMQANINANDAADVGSWVVALMLYNTASPAVQIVELLIWNQSITLTPKSFSNSYKLASNLPVGVYQVLASVRNPVTYVWQHVTQTGATFTVG